MKRASLCALIGFVVGLVFAPVLSPERSAGQTGDTVIHPHGARAGANDPLPPVPVSLSGNLAIPCYGFARLELLGSYSSAGWMIFPDRTTQARIVSSDESAWTDSTGRFHSVYRLSGPPGRYDFGAFAETPAGIKTVQGTVRILPPLTPGPEPAPPQPTPEPTPPQPEPAPPQPTPNPPPIPDPGLRVLMVYESEDLTKYPPGQMLVLYDGGLREYMSTACVKVGDVPEYRIWDKDVPMQGESTIWQSAMARPRTSLPWILISNGQTGYEGALPPDAAATLALIKQYDPAVAGMRRRKAG